MRVLTQALFATVASLALAACGGGGGGGNDSAFQPQGITVSVSPATTSSTPSSLVGITVRVTGERGAPLPDGTTVRLQVSPPGVGLLSSTQASAPPNAGGTGLLAEAVSASLSGGLANFRLHTRSVGTATLTASVTDPNAPQRTVTGTASVSVSAGAPNDPRLTIQLAGSSTLPVNRIGINYSSPYYTPVTVTWRTLDGALVTPRDDQDFVGVSVLPTETAFFTFLDDPDTTDIDENFVALGQGPAKVVAGRSFFRVFSSSTPGTATLTVSAVDQQTGETISAVQQFVVTNGTPGVPGAVVFDTDTTPVYIQGINAPATKAVQVQVLDGGGAFVPNPPAGVNNLRLELQSTLNGGERLSGVNAAGTPVTGATLNTRTNNGEANFSLQTGTVAGTVIIRATADRADNNVDNGIADAVTSTRQIVISDGRIFDIQIQTANFEGVSGQVAGPPPGNTSPDATYNFLVTALATDRNGNPVPAGAEIRFGLVDEPQRDGLFTLSGSDGNPQENGTTFTAAQGGFLGAGPGDTLLVLGEGIANNRDLESARTIASIQSSTSLTVSAPFNPNDVTGTSIDAGPIFPYVIGRAADANVRASGLTDSLGVAASVVTYPARRLGKTIYLWVQGNGTIVPGTSRARIVSDVETFRLPGAGPGTLTVRPGSLIANRATSLTTCVSDSAGNPVPGVNVAFAFEQPATGAVNNVGGSGRTPPTGADGCVTNNVVANLAPGSTGEGALVFRIGEREAANRAEVRVPVVAAGTPVLSIGPAPVQVFAGPPNQQAFIAVCVNDGGGPIPNVVISGSCTLPTPAAPLTSPASLQLGVPQITVADGCAVIPLTYTGMAVQDGANVVLRTSTCSFTTNAGLSGSVVVAGTRRCGDGLTPALPGCP
jgi:hypothetical protein